MAFNYKLSKYKKTLKSMMWIKNKVNVIIPL